MVEAHAVQDKSIAKVASFDFEHQRLARLVTDYTNAKVCRTLFENDALQAELASLKGRFIEMEKLLLFEWRQKAAAQ